MQPTDGCPHTLRHNVMKTRPRRNTCHITTDVRDFAARALCMPPVLPMLCITFVMSHDVSQIGHKRCTSKHQRLLATQRRASSFDGYMYCARATQATPSVYVAHRNVRGMDAVVMAQAPYTIPFTNTCHTAGGLAAWNKSCTVLVPHVHFMDPTRAFICAWPAARVSQVWCVTCVVMSHSLS